MHTFVRRNVGKLLRDFNRLIETAILIDQSVFLALASRPDTALTDRVDVGLVLASPLRHLFREVVVGRLQKLLELCAFAVGEFLRFAKYPGIRTAQNVL